MASSTFHSFHTKRLASRMAEIEKVFSIGAMKDVWSKYIRPGLRNQEIPDLHDYNDFHWDKNAVFSQLHSAICSGNYAPQRSIPVRIEKRLGVTRTLVLPAVVDCIVLQCMVEEMLPIALKKRPSRNSFFSRSHGFGEASFSFGKDYIWFRQWRQLSKTRLEFISNHNYICVTDVANYFDNIDYANLRNILSSLHGIGEVTLDILFSVLDRVSWRPDYLPSPGRSLPQVNFDAPRLLSHVYLYEVDAFLKKSTGDQFVRWVDDMTMAAQSVSQGKSLLRDLDQLLLTRGLRLNAGKTVILSAASARRYFHVQENGFLDALKVSLDKYPAGKRRDNALNRSRSKFDQFLKAENFGHWEKVAKRYMTHFSGVKDPHALSFAKRQLLSAPGLRDSILRYYKDLGPRRDTFTSIAEYLSGPDLLDDASLMQAVRVLTDWQVKPNSTLHRDIRALGVKLGAAPYLDQNPFFFMAALWLISKYGMRKHLRVLIHSAYDIWSHSEFLARQVAGVHGKFRGHAEGEVIRRMVEALRFPSASSVYTSFDQMTVGPKIKSAVRLYVLNGKHVTDYSIQRFLVCLHVLTSTSVDKATRSALKNDAMVYVSDPLFLRVIKSIKI